MTDQPSSEVARARSDGERLVKPRKVSKSSLDPNGPAQLTAKHALLIEYMVFGSPIPGHHERFGIEPGTPLSLAQACDAVGMKRRTARTLLASPIGSKAMTTALAALRNGAKAQAMHQIIRLVNEQGEGKAADRKVQLEAARDVLGLKDSSAAQVNVQINQTTNVRPGYVIKMPDTDAAASPADSAIDVTPNAPDSHGTD